MIPLRDYHPSGIFPILTIGLIAINVLVFAHQLTLSRQPARSNPALWREEWKAAGCQVPDLFVWRQTIRQFSEGDNFSFQFGVTPCEITHGVDLPPLIPFSIWLTLLTSMFLHGGWLHLLGNLWYLWIFGDNIEGSFGRFRFLLFYLACGVVAAFTQISAGPESAIPMIGASGAISGVLGAYMVLLPFGRVLTLIGIFPFIRLVQLPAVVLLGFWFVLQFIAGAIESGEMGGVAYWAHLGGFIAGALIAWVLKQFRAGVATD
jgi:membrane associated rhomboid family serine protease